MSNEKNPFAKDSLNLTEQARILKENPALAERLKAEAIEQAKAAPKEQPVSIIPWRTGGQAARKRTRKIWMPQG